MCDLESFQEYRELQSGHAWEGTEMTKVQGWNQSMYMSFLTQYVKTDPQSEWVHANN